MNVILTKQFSFEAAHRLPLVAPGHKCGILHGHSFRVEISVKGPVNPETGMHIDYADVSSAWAPIHRALDHHTLNDVEGLQNPTSENLCGWLWAKLAVALPTLYEVAVMETCTSKCTYRHE